VRAAAIDLGAVRVGLAVADDLGLLAHPRPFLDGKNQHALLRHLKELQAAEQIELFVLGLPRELNGREGPAAKRARAFAEKLEQATPAKVELYDEWLSTREAAGRLRAQGLNAKQQRGRIDSAAAAILLQSWLDKAARSDGRGTSE
jgi:putative Holliday junction resolvase